MSWTLRDTRLLLASATHERLGRESALSLLPQPLLGDIASLARPLAVVAVGGCDCRSSDALDVSRRCWHPLPAPPGPASPSAAVCLHGADATCTRVVALGDSAADSSAVHALARGRSGAWEGAWERAASLPGPVGHPSAVESRGAAFVWSKRDAWRYDAPADRWDPVAPRPVCCEYAGAAELGGLLYAVGGFGRTQVNNVDTYDPRSGLWSAAPSMRALRSNLGVAVCAGCIYAVGGYDSEEEQSEHSSAERFDPRAGRWQSIAPMPLGKRDGLCCAEIDGCVWAFGGYRGGKLLSTVERFDPATGRWDSNCPQMPRARRFFGLAVVL
eukprot:m51a1_g7221 putative kelch domain-containing protein (328) ;mRNA; r:5288-6897